MLVKSIWVFVSLFFRFFFFVSDSFAFLPTAPATVLLHLGHEMDREKN